MCRLRELLNRRNNFLWKHVRPELSLGRMCNLLASFFGTISSVTSQKISISFAFLLSAKHKQSRVSKHSLSRACCRSQNLCARWILCSRPFGINGALKSFGRASRDVIYDYSTYTNSQFNESIKYSLGMPVIGCSCIETLVFCFR